MYKTTPRTIWENFRNDFFGAKFGDFPDPQGWLGLARFSGGGSDFSEISVKIQQKYGWLSNPDGLRENIGLLGMTLPSILLTPSAVPLETISGYAYKNPPCFRRSEKICYKTPPPPCFRPKLFTKTQHFQKTQHLPKSSKTRGVGFL